LVLQFIIVFNGDIVMKLENIVPWGRNLSQYVAMFLLTKDDLNAKILGCGDGPSSFNTEVDLNGGSVG
jgi:hypothetical protein